jgi:PAS domain S-box-containing protein
MYNRSRLKVSILTIALGAILLVSGLYGFILLGAREQAVKHAADARLLAAAHELEHLQPLNYHDGLTGSNAVTAAQYAALVASNNQFCVKTGLQYVWSVLVLGPRQIVFTSATASDHQLTNQLYAKFFERHQDPDAFAPALQSMQPTLSVFRNQWGEGRMVLVPKRDSQGRVYLLGASMSLTELDGLLNKTVAESFCVAALVALLAGLLLARLLRSVLGPIETLTAAAQRMTLGDLDTSLTGTGSREAQALAHALEALRASIRQKLELAQKSAAQIRHLNDVLLSIQRVSRLILQEKDVQKLLQGVCEALVQTRGYVIVWVGQPDTDSKLVREVARAGNTAEVNRHAPITWDDSPSGRGPSGTAIRERRTVVINDIRTDPSFPLWSEAVEASGAFAIASMPLQDGAYFFGALTVKSDHAQAFDAEEVELLTNMARDLGQALKVIAEEAELCQSRAALQASEEQYRTMLASAMDGFVVVDLQGKVLDCNAAFCALFGYAREEMLRLAIPDLIDQETGKEFRGRVQQIIAQGAQRFESNHLRRDGTQFAAEVSAHYSPLMGGRLIVFVRDITARKQAEALQQRYQLILQHARDVFLLVMLEGQIVEANEAAVQFYGYTRAELLGLNVRDLRAHDAPQLIKLQMEAARSSGVLFETYHSHKDGHLLPVEVSSRGVQMAGEELLLSIVRDIAARQAAERGLRENEQRLSQLAEVTGELIWEVDAQGLITYINDVSKTMLGYEPAELIGKVHFYELITDDIREDLARKTYSAFALRQKLDALACTSKTKDGRILDLVVTGLPRLDAQGNFLGYRGANRDVTAQKQAERSIHELAERLDLATHAAHIGVWDFDVAHDHLLWNDQMYELYGRTAASFTPTYAAWRAALHPDDNERSHETLQNALADRQDYASEFRIVCPDGGIRHVEVHAHIIRDAEGRAVRILGINMDITRKKLEAEALQLAKENFRHLVEEINDAIYEVNTDGVITYASPVFHALFGFENAELVGHVFSEFILPEDQPAALAAHQAGLQGHNDLSEFRIQAKDGAIHWVRSSSQPIQNAGRVRGLRGTIADITESKAAQTALWASEERFRAIVEKTSDCFLLTDGAGIITYASPTIFGIVGRTPEALLGHYLLENAHAESRREAQLVLGRLLAQPQDPIRITIRVKHEDGTWRLLECLATNLLEHRAIKSLLIHCQDITARESLERQLRQAQKLEAIGTLAGGVAHDFNNMLFAIMGFTSMALKRAKKDKVLTEDLEQVLSASRRSSELVRQLLIFSRQGEKASVEVAVTPILKETCRLLRATVPTTINIQLALQATHDVVRADPVQVQQVIMNLGTNAFHAMREKGGVMTLQLDELAQASHPENLEAPQGWLRLCVSDTGCGIPVEHRDRLFEPFFTTKAVGEGTGLGLPVVHGIVTTAGGFIEIESEVGLGTTFKIYLPLLASAASTPVADISVTTPAGAAYRVLCVDDEQVLTNMIQRTLKPLGYRVTCFNDSTAALAAFRQSPQDFDLLLTDHGMPQLTGLDLIKAVRAVRPGFPAILLTGYDSEMVSASECRALNIFLRHKPLTQEELGNTLHVAVRPASTENPDATDPRD